MVVVVFVVFVVVVVVVESNLAFLPPLGVRPSESTPQKDGRQVGMLEACHSPDPSTQCFLLVI